MVAVSDLDFSSALEFTYSIKNHNLEEGEVFDFSAVHNCDPFPMLVASTAIRQLRRESSDKSVMLQIAIILMLNICGFIKQ